MKQSVSNVDIQALEKNLAALGRPAVALGRPKRAPPPPAVEKLQSDFKAVGRPIAQLSAPVDFLNTLRAALAAPIAAVSVRV